MKELKITASLNNLDTVQEFIDEQMKEYQAAEKTISQVDVCVEEIFVNIANYAYDPKQGDAKISCEIVQKSSNMLMIRFEDTGKPFNPVEQKDADITLPAEDRPIGGLGIFMVKKIMEKVEYEYRDGKNILTLWKKI